MDDQPWCHEHNQPATTEVMVGLADFAVDEDGYSEVFEFACKECA